MNKNYNNKCGKVVVSYDPSVIRKRKTTKEIENEKEYLKLTDELLDGNSNYDKGFRSTDNKIKRMKQFKKGYEDGKFVTVAAAVDYMNRYVPHGISYDTCLKYAKELHLMIFDSRKNIWLQGIKPQYIIEMERRKEFDDQKD